MGGLKPWRNHDDAVEALAHAEEKAAEYRRTALAHETAGNSAMAIAAMRIATAYDALAIKYAEDEQRLAAGDRA